MKGTGQGEGSSASELLALAFDRDGVGTRHLPGVGQPLTAQLLAITSTHRGALEALGDLVRMAVQLEIQCDFRGSRNRQAFEAHSPDLKAPLAEWVAAVEHARAAPGAVWERLASAAVEFGIAEPPFSVGSLVDRLAMVTLARARTWQLEVPYVLDTRYLVDNLRSGRQVTIHVEGQRVAHIASDLAEDADQGVDSLTQRIQGLFDVVQVSTEALAVSEARDSVLDVKHNLLDSLSASPPMSSAVVAEGCPVCRDILSAGH